MPVEPEDLRIGESTETAPGVIVERRCFLKTAAILLGAVAIPGLAPLRLGATEHSALSIEEFLAEAVPVAEAMLENPSLLGQDHYLLTIAALAVRLGPVAQPDFRETPAAGPGTFIGGSGAANPLVVLHWKMNPGSEIRRHAHTYGNVVTLGLEGATEIDNFEMMGERDYDSPKPFQVRRTLSQWLTAGSTNLVNLERNYIHGFRAGTEGARGLDITTRIHERRKTPYLVLGKQIEGDHGVFEGHWTE